MIKIAHIANPVAGVGVYLDLLVKHANKNKFQHIILCNPDVISSDFQFDEIYHIPLVRDVNIIADIRSLLSLIKVVKSIQPDVIHCHSAKGGVLGRVVGTYLKIPTLYTPHAYSYLSTESALKRIFFKTIEKTFRFFPPNTIACSESEFNRTVVELKFKESKVYLWNNSIDDHLKNTQKNNVYTLPKHFICSIGRPSYQKHTELLIKSIIEAKKKIKDINLVILGVGHYSPSLENVKALIRNNNLEENITLIPWVERNDVINILNKCEFYISSSRYEGLPYAVIEALALSKACIVTNVDGNSDLIHDGYNGFLVNENPILISQRIVELLENKKMLLDLSRNARKEYINKYNIKDNITALESIYVSQTKY